MTAETDRLIVRNVFVDVVIPRKRVVEVETLNGLEIVTLDGKRYNSSGYGQSVLQVLFRSRSVESAGNSIERWLAEAQSESGELTPVRVRLRRWWYVGLPVCVACALTYEMLLQALTPAIRPFFM